MTYGVYTASKTEIDTHHIIKHALINGSVNHLDAEAFDPRCTVIRTRMSEITNPAKWGWPIRNVNPPNKLACYVIDYKELVARACCEEEWIPRAAKDWADSGRKFDACYRFVEFLAQNYRRLVPRGKLQTDFFEESNGRYFMAGDGVMPK